MIDETDRLFDGIKVKIRQRRQELKQTLGDVAGKVFDAYREALRDDFTTQGVIHASTYGHNISDWSSISPEMQDTLDALCVRYPESVDREIASSDLSDSVVEYLREQGLTISDEQIQLFPDLMKGIMQGLEHAGVKFSNNVRQARILGLKPLVYYRDWLLSGGQTFMDLNQYEIELNLTNNAIRANQNVLVTALRVSGDIEVDYGRGLESGRSQERIIGIAKAGIESNRLGQGPRFVVTYKTKEGKKGEIDIFRASVTSLTEKSDESRLYRLLYEKRIDAESGLENLGYEDSIEALVGLPQDLSQELRANVWRRYLKRFGVDLSKNAEAVFVDPTEKEKVTFFYRTQERNGQDYGVMVGIAFDERYGDKHTFVCSRDKMQEDIQRAESIRERFEADYKPLIEPTAVRTYVEQKQRLTRPRP
ncbi:MAG: hypothetical protein Q8O13_01410 [Candidatus Omnitrophota bacterium]|nr:hypothetical protein [Candidatus Omnitrophota bacterium]